MRLYHYTCDHAFERIRRQGVLIPNPHPLLPGVPAVVWLTDLATPLRDELGLTSQSLDCDRTAHRIEVDTDDAEPWSAFAHRHRLPWHQRGVFEDGKRLPAHWYVATKELAVIPRG